MRNEIPKWGWYNGMFLFDYANALENEGMQDIREFFNSFKKRQLNGIEFPIINQGLAISLLYMLLVVPREMWENQQSTGTQFSFITKKLFIFKIGKDIDNWSFIRCMRNSVAHANFDMNSDGEYTFWNQRQVNNRSFEVTILHSDLFRFISEMGKYYINEIEV